MRWSAALLVWFLIILAESVHGTVRQLFLAPLLGDFRSRQVCFFSGVLIIYTVVRSTIHWLLPFRGNQSLQVGFVWMALTLAFELTLTKLTNQPLSRFLEDYDLPHGGLMGFGLLFLIAVPGIAASRAPSAATKTA